MRLIHSVWQRKNVAKHSALPLIGALLAFHVFACAPQTNTRFGAGSKAPAVSAELHTQERAMFALVNRDRAGEGLPPLKYDERLADIARAHSADMRKNRFFEHHSPTNGTPDDRLLAAGYLVLAARENLSEAPDEVQSQQGLMLSPHHHENLMARDITHIGVGIVKGGVADGRNWLFTQLFARPARQESAAQVRSAVLDAIEQARKAAQKPALKRSPELTALAEQQVTTLRSSELDASTDAVGQQVAKRLAERPLAGIGGLALGVQALLDSSAFVAPPWVSDARVRAYGIAVNKTKDDKGRPQMLVLMLAGMQP